jgi:hypothetical protein
MVVLSCVAKRKNKAAVELGRRGGKARAANMTAEELSKIGKQGAKARWAQKNTGATKRGEKIS